MRPSVYLFVGIFLYGVTLGAIKGYADNLYYEAELELTHIKWRSALDTMKENIKICDGLALDFESMTACTQACMSYDHDNDGRSEPNEYYQTCNSVNYGFQCTWQWLRPKRHQK